MHRRSCTLPSPTERQRKWLGETRQQDQPALGHLRIALERPGQCSRQKLGGAGAFVGHFLRRTKARDDLGGFPLRKSGVGVVSGRFPWQASWQASLWDESNQGSCQRQHPQTQGSPSLPPTPMPTHSHALARLPHIRHAFSLPFFRFSGSLLQACLPSLTPGPRRDDFPWVVNLLRAGAWNPKHRSLSERGSGSHKKLISSPGKYCARFTGRPAEAGKSWDFFLMGHQVCHCLAIPAAGRLPSLPTHFTHRWTEGCCSSPNLVWGLGDISCP